jgi:hypothetical protein
MAWQWQIWMHHSELRDVWIARTPNVPGCMFEDPDKDHARTMVINQVAGYINDCRNARKEVTLISNDDIGSPELFEEVVNVTSK